MTGFKSGSVVRGKPDTLPFLLVACDDPAEPEEEPCESAVGVDVLAVAFAAAGLTLRERVGVDHGFAASFMARSRWALRAALICLPVSLCFRGTECVTMGSPRDDWKGTARCRALRCVCIRA